MGARAPQDGFWYSKSNGRLLNQGLDHVVFVRYLYRVAADHYTLNSTEVVLRSKSWKDVMKELRSTTER